MKTWKHNRTTLRSMLDVCERWLKPAKQNWKKIRIIFENRIISKKLYFETDPLWSFHVALNFLQYLYVWHIEFPMKWMNRSYQHCCRWQWCIHLSYSPLFQQDYEDVAGMGCLWWHRTPPPPPCHDNCTPVSSGSSYFQWWNSLQESIQHYGPRIHNENVLHTWLAVPKCAQMASQNWNIRHHRESVAVMDSLNSKKVFNIKAKQNFQNHWNSWTRIKLWL